MRRAFLAIGVAASSLVASPVWSADVADAAAADSLAVPMTHDARDELWPVELDVAIVWPDASDPLPARRMVVPDGQAMKFHNSVRTPVGERRFEFRVTPRHHPGNAVELEWTLQVFEARYDLAPGLEGLQTYALHRLGLGPRPPLAPPVLRAARADIVTCHGNQIAHAVTLGSDRYEIRLAARRGDG